MFQIEYKATEGAACIQQNRLRGLCRKDWIDAKSSSFMDRLHGVQKRLVHLLVIEKITYLLCIICFAKNVNVRYALFVSFFCDWVCIERSSGLWLSPLVFFFESISILWFYEIGRYIIYLSICFQMWRSWATVSCVRFVWMRQSSACCSSVDT